MSGNGRFLHRRVVLARCIAAAGTGRSRRFGGLARLRTALALSLSVSLAAPLPAAAAQGAGMERSGAASEGGPAMRANLQYLTRAQALLGSRVKNAAGEDLGKVEELVVDTTRQVAHYAVLSFGGVLGLGDKLYAYPVRTLRPTSAAGELTLDMARERLQQAPGFSPERWPEWGTSAYLRNVDRYFGSAEATQAGPTLRLLRASELIGSEAVDGEGKAAAKVADLVVGLGNGRVACAVLEVQPAEGGPVLVPVALSALVFPHGGNAAVLRAPLGEEAMRHAFPRGQWPNFNDERYQRELDTYLRDSEVKNARP